MLFVTHAQLKLLMEKYHGKRISVNDVHPKSAFDTQIQATLQLNITDIYKNYTKNYDKIHGSTFFAFLRWIAIKAMQDSACTYRLINGECFQFDNLPLKLTVRTNDKREQAVYYLNDVTYSTWNTFCRGYSYFARAPMQNDVSKLPMDAMAHQIEDETSNISQKHEYAHQPSICFGNLYNKEDKIFLPLHVSFSQATMTPELVDVFLQRFEAYAKLKPFEIEKLVCPKKVNEQEMITDIISFDFLKQSKHYAPGYDTKSDITEHSTTIISQFIPTIKAKL